MRRNVLILEDLGTARELLARIVETCGKDIRVYAFSTVGEACECMMENEIDLFLIDIILKPGTPNDFSGVNFARYIRRQEQYLAADIIFVTSLMGLEAELMRSVHCFDYIEKPIREERVRKVVSEALRKRKSREPEDEVRFVRKDRVSYAVHEKDILYLESHQKILYIHKKDDVLEIPNLSLKQFLKSIRTQKFLIPTKVTAVNLNYIEYVDDVNRYVKVEGKKELIEIGYRMRGRFLTELNEMNC